MGAKVSDETDTPACRSELCGPGSLADPSAPVTLGRTALSCTGWNGAEWGLEALPGCGGQPVTHGEPAFTYLRGWDI